MRRILCSLACLLVAAAASAQVYKWTDPSGKTHYGDRPPDDAKKQELAIRIRSYDGPVTVTDWAAILRRKAPASAPRASSGITMYMTEWCPHCKNARSYFKAKGIAYTEINVDTSETGRKEYKALGGSGVPMILVGDKMMSGFSAESFEALRK